MFACIYAAEGSSPHTVFSVARDFSPRIEILSAREVTLELVGLERLFGDAKTIGQELRRTAADRGLRVRVAIASTRTTARLLAHHRAGMTIVNDGDERAVLDELPLELLAALPNANGSNANGSNDPNAPNDPNNLLPTLRRWGLRTLGELAALPPDDVAARLGHAGVEWQRLARGEDPQPLVPSQPEERFEEAIDLEWPIEGLEPLSFVLARLMEPLSLHLERRDRGAAVLHVRLHLVKRNGVAREIHERSLQLPAPIRDARTLRTLALLDLESHPPAAAIDRVVVAVDPTPGRVVQFSLLTRPLPSPEQLSTLMARLTALMGEDHCGSAVTVDSWAPGAFEMKPFAPRDGGDGRDGRERRDGRDGQERLDGPFVALRRFRFPIPVRMRLDGDIPVRISIDRRGLSGGTVTAFAGPWRTSGGWWISVEPLSPVPPNWDRDEWDVTVSDGATYRVFRQRDSDAWFVEGIVD